jgi:hypothetical protein
MRSEIFISLNWLLFYQDFIDFNVCQTLIITQYGVRDYESMLLLDNKR